MQIPGVKVDRKAFLVETFPDLSNDKVAILLEKGPIHSHLFTQKEVRKKALQLANKRKLQSSAASFAAGLPGGVAMAATIPADALQFLGGGLCELHKKFLIYMAIKISGMAMFSTKKRYKVKCCCLWERCWEYLVQLA